MKRVTAETLTSALFETFLSRSPDLEGFEYWVKQLMDSDSIDSVVNAFLNTSESLEKKIFFNPVEIEILIKKISSEIHREINIIDIGSILMDTEVPVWQALSQHKPLNVLGFDPQISNAEVISSGINKVKVRNRKLALGDGTTRDFYVNNEINTSSFYRILPNLGLNHLDNLKVTESIRTETKKLDDVIDLAVIDFLKIDVQGFELEVLSHSTEVLKNTYLVFLEVEFNEIYRDQPLMAEIDIFLRGKGFKLIDLFNRRYPYLNTLTSNSADTLIWGDALYIKAPNKIEDKAIQALILGTIYKKWNLAEFMYRNI
jgi:FkbM family methyltransferase